LFEYAEENVVASFIESHREESFIMPDLSLARRALTIAASASLAGSALLAQGGRGGPRTPPMVLTIAGWADGTQIPAKFTQAGEQVSPELKWTNVPPGTQSFVVNMLDPDVAVMRGPEAQPHWIVWNIPATAAGLPEGMKPGAEQPDGTRQISASGPQYRGPGAPATGPLHHYTFEVYALDTKIDVAPSTATPAINAALETRAAVMKAMQGHVLGKAVYVGLFHRPQ
jgi:Raf kinase inhibitor-like YbhB/YbcL family protein